MPKEHKEFIHGDVGVRYDPNHPQYGREINLVRFNGARGFLTLWLTVEELETIVDAADELLEYLGGGGSVAKAATP